LNSCIGSNIRKLSIDS